MSLIPLQIGGSSGGGTSSPLTTKGDLYGFSTVNARIPVSSDGYVLTADSAQALGVKWAAGGGITVNTTTISGGSSGLIPYNAGGVYGETGLSWDGGSRTLSSALSFNFGAGSAVLEMTTGAIFADTSIADGGPFTHFLGAFSASFLKPFHGVAAQSFLMGFADSDPAGSIIEGEIRVKTGTNLNFNADNVTSTNNLKTLRYYSKEAGGGADASGSGTLSGGTVTITTSACATTSRVFLTDTSAGALTNVGSLTVVAGSGSFVVKSTNVLDTSTFNWFILTPY